eukprot:95366_1
MSTSNGEDVSAANHAYPTPAASPIHSATPRNKKSVPRSFKSPENESDVRRELTYMEQIDCDTELKAPEPDMFSPAVWREEDDHHSHSSHEAAREQKSSEVNCQPVEPPAGEKEPLPEYSSPEGHERSAPALPDHDEFDPYLFIKHMPPLPLEYRNRKACLPPLKDSKKRTLVLDLDETLVHCSVEPLEGADLTFPVIFNSIEYTVYARKRPYFLEFLRKVSEWFEIIVFTASQKVYAEKLLDILDPEHKFIRHRVFRDSCVCIDGNFLKDLSVLGRELARTCIIDNSPQAFGFQLDNGIPIESWFDDDADCELVKILPLLERLRDCDDVRPELRREFGLRDHVNRL